MNWKEVFSNKKKRYEFVLSLILLAIVLTALTNFLNYVELRPGVILPDPILDLFDPVDLTWLTFGLIYLSLITAILHFSLTPEKLLFAIQLYTLMVIVRITAMYLMPLEPPAKMLALNDPFVEFFGTGKTLTKDLFFSGHTGTLFLLFLVTEKKIIKYVFLLFTFLVALCVILQHVHYTIDVFAAPFFVAVCYFLLKKFKTINNSQYV